MTSSGVLMLRACSSKSDFTDRVLKSKTVAQVGPSCIDFIYSIAMHSDSINVK